MKQDIKTLWSNLANNKQNSAHYHIQYCILRAMQSKGEDKVAIAKHLLRKAFTPVTKMSKLANGRTPFDTLQTLLSWRGTMPLHEKGIMLGVPTNDLLEVEEKEQYFFIVSLLTSKRKEFVRQYSYFFTRQDIFREYQLVQTAHAALELGNKLTDEQVKDLHFTCCGVENLEELERVERILKSMKVEYVVFREPDIGNQKTAIGVYPIEEHKRGLLRNFALLRFNEPDLALYAPVSCNEEEVVD